MGKDKRPYNLLSIVKSVIKPKKQSEEKEKPKYTPSWMYRNE